MELACGDELRTKKPPVHARKVYLGHHYRWKCQQVPSGECIKTDLELRSKHVRGPVLAYRDSVRDGERVSVKNGQGSEYLYTDGRRNSEIRRLASEEGIFKMGKKLFGAGGSNLFSSVCHIADSHQSPSRKRTLPPGSHPPPSACLICPSSPGRATEFISSTCSILLPPHLVKSHLSSARVWALEAPF